MLIIKPKYSVQVLAGQIVELHLCINFCSAPQRKRMKTRITSAAYDCSEWERPTSAGACGYISRAKHSPGALNQLTLSARMREMLSVNSGLRGKTTKFRRYTIN